MKFKLLRGAHISHGEIQIEVGFSFLVFRFNIFKSWGPLNICWYSIFGIRFQHFYVVRTFKYVSHRTVWNLNRCWYSILGIPFQYFQVVSCPFSPIKFNLGGKMEVWLLTGKLLDTTLHNGMMQFSNRPEFLLNFCCWLISPAPSHFGSCFLSF